MDFDDVSPAGLLLGLIAGGVGLIVARGMATGVFWKIASAIVCAVAGYFVGAKIAED